MLIYLSDNFSPTKIIKSKTFEIDHESKNILIKNGSSFNPQNNEVGKNLDITIAVPNLHNQLSLTTQIPNFFSTLNYVYSSTLPQHVKLSMLRSLLKIFFNHFVLLLYTLLTFVLFFIAPHSLYIKWILILIPYPLITILVTLIN